MPKRVDGTLYGVGGVITARFQILEWSIELAVQLATVRDAESTHTHITACVNL